jgi:hypothetical protein
VDALPRSDTSRTIYFERVVGQLQAHGLARGELFDALTNLFSGNSALIATCRSTFLAAPAPDAFGASGSPVFDSQWRVVAIHTMGGELPLPGAKHMVYRNQGVPIQRVLAGIAALGLKLS